jgi:hypothetical protein
VQSYLVSNSKAKHLHLATVQVNQQPAGAVVTPQCTGIDHRQPREVTHHRLMRVSVENEAIL